MDPFAGPKTKNSSARLEERVYAGTGISEDNAEAATRSTAAPLTTHSSGNAPFSPLSPREDSRESLAPPPLIFHDFADSMFTRRALPGSSAEHLKLYEQIVTPYNANAFEHELKTDWHLLLVNILRNGTPLGEMPQLTKSIIIPNHMLVAKFPQVVKDYLAEEKSKIESIMHGHIMSSPLIVAEQVQAPGIPTKFRVCQHLSKAQAIPRSARPQWRFLGRPLLLLWGSISKQQHRHGIGRDYLLAIRSPNAIGNYDYDHASMLKSIASLNVPFHPADIKGDLEFTFETTYTGFCWNLPLKRVSLPNEKCLKYLNWVRQFSDEFHRRKAPLIRVESIHGTLCHIAFIYAKEKSHLPPILNFMASYWTEREEYEGQYPPSSVLTELSWWHNIC
ncbi:reverse transcriptase ribonuclease h [Lentinula edodes]|uniref:Reverse transcriptase ribonuclease h n=1 Tax=Lentinula edodes TaxID=5353 RepID=A0A1Q3E2P3_LENED|nr:reverse transcriptase ribonuclease h [Lentinula edodes]